jgi:hypothetical protein
MMKAIGTLERTTLLLNGNTAHADVGLKLLLRGIRLAAVSADMVLYISSAVVPQCMSVADNLALTLPPRFAAKVAEFVAA